MSSNLYLVGSTSLLTENNSAFVTKDKFYKVIVDRCDSFEIVDDSGFRNTLSKNTIDYSYYGKWFYFTHENYLPKLHDNESLLKILDLAMIHLPTAELRIEARDLLQQFKN